MTPRRIQLEGLDHSKVLSYVDVILGGAEVGDKVAIIGAGGIGFDVAEFLTHNESEQNPIDAYLDEWGVDRSMSERGGLKKMEATVPRRQVTLCQRKTGKLGAGLGIGGVCGASLGDSCGGLVVVGELAAPSAGDEGGDEGGEWAAATTMSAANAVHAQRKDGGGGTGVPPA